MQGKKGMCPWRMRNVNYLDNYMAVSGRVEGGGRPSETVKGEMWFILHLGKRASLADCNHQLD
jgi:hypothetical protein